MDKTNLINKLIDNRMLDSNVKCKQFDETLAKLVNIVVEEDIPALCSAFDDNTADDEVMYGLIHLIESMLGDKFFENIALGTTQMEDNAHEWAKTLNMRILNSTLYREKYGMCLKKCNCKTIEKTKDIFNEIKQENPGKFKEKVEDIMQIIE